MPVYKKHKLVHIHIPKTAGTALGAYFASINDMSWGKEYWVGEEVRDGICYEYQHLTMAELNKFSHGEYRWFHSFAVLRNPYTRLLSDFFWREVILERHPDSAIKDSKSLHDFIMAIPDDINTSWPELIRNADQKEANLLIHVRPQHHYVLAKDGRRLVDEFLRFELLDVEFARLLSRLGLRSDSIIRPAEHDISAHFDREMLDRINQIYQLDFELGGYEMI